MDVIVLGTQGEMLVNIENNVIAAQGYTRKGVLEQVKARTTHKCALHSARSTEQCATMLTRVSRR